METRDWSRFVNQPPNEDLFLQKLNITKTHRARLQKVMVVPDFFSLIMVQFTPSTSLMDFSSLAPATSKPCAWEKHWYCSLEFISYYYFTNRVVSWVVPHYKGALNRTEKIRSDTSSTTNTAHSFYSNGNHTESSKSHFLMLMILPQYNLLNFWLEKARVAYHII